MDCIEARALKSSFLSQMALNSNSPVFYNDDVWFLTGAAAAATVTVEDFPVEDLLNLDLPEMEFQDALEDDDFSQKGNSNFPSSSSSSFSGADEFDCLSAGEIAVPVEGLENLEWLSQFVHDYSSSEHSLLCPAGGYSAKLPAKSANRVDPVPKPKAPVLFLLTIPRKPRTQKTTRPRSSPWMLPSPLPPPAADSSSTTSSCNGSSSTIPPVLFANPVHDMDWFSSAEKPPVKRQKRKLEAETGRRCTHCQVQKTPQWRTGPLGPKTLCNACGVRFKSGRLFPEYRPACSPSFSQEVHSNSHRKVLEMRRMKEEVVVGAEEAPPPVLSQSLSALG